MQDRASTQRPSLMRAPVEQGVELTADMEDPDRATTDVDDQSPSFGLAFSARILRRCSSVNEADATAAVGESKSQCG